MKLILKIIYVLLGIVLLFYAVVTMGFLSFKQSSIYSLSYDLGFCTKNPVDCIKGLFSSSDTRNYYKDSHIIGIPCIPSSGITCP